MIDLILKSRVPLVKISTTDTLNIEEVLRYHVGDQLVIANLTKGDISKWQNKYIAALSFDEDIAIEELYPNLEKAGSVCILINEGIESPLIFDAGVLGVPQKLLEEKLHDLLEIEDEETLNELLPAMGSLTLKEVDDVIRITQTRDGSVDSEGIKATRRMLTSSLQGLEPVNTEFDYYLPPSDLEAWVEDNRKFFLRSEELRLIPRGLVFEGKEGCGKTQGAKYIAQKFGVPLYRMDISGIMIKWLGESEGRLSTVLQQIDQEEPCVFLIDEVEKIFNAKDSDSGVTDRMLAQLLWWMQTHSSRVLTIMTTNDLSIMPKTMYRPGRIDKVYTFEGLPYHEAVNLAQGILDSFEEAPVESANLVTKKLEEVYVEETEEIGIKVTHARIEQLVIDCIRKLLK